MVIRSAKSGVDGTSPDLIALSKNYNFIVECKAWEGGLNFKKEKINIMKNFEKKTNINFFIAWKMNNKGWRFFPLKFLHENEKGFSIPVKDFELGLSLKEILNLIKKGGENT